MHCLQPQTWGGNEMQKKLIFCFKTLSVFKGVNVLQGICRAGLRVGRQSWVLNDFEKKKVR